MRHTVHIQMGTMVLLQSSGMSYSSLCNWWCQEPINNKVLHIKKKSCTWIRHAYIVMCEVILLLVTWSKLAGQVLGSLPAGLVPVKMLIKALPPACVVGMKLTITQLINSILLEQERSFLVWQPPYYYWLPMTRPKAQHCRVQQWTLLKRSFTSLDSFVSSYLLLATSVASCKSLSWLPGKSISERSWSSRSKSLPIHTMYATIRLPCLILTLNSYNN